MTLGRLIRHLQDVTAHNHQGFEMPYGLENPHSYRGSYEKIAFEVCAYGRTTTDILDEVVACVGESFPGWKGGDYVMDADTLVYVAREGDLGRPLTVGLLDILTYGIGSRPTLVNSLSWPSEEIEDLRNY